MPPVAETPSASTSVVVGEGTVLDGRYRLERQIGEGSMGDIFQAVRLPQNERVAVKVLKAERALKQVLVERFLREARSASLIDHPHVVKVYEFGHVPDGPIYFAMEYLEGEDLSSWLRHAYRMPWRRCKTLLLQLASALRAAHECGIVHRDIKPSNCLLLETPEGDHVKLVDFGVAKLDDALVNRRLTRAADVIGTALYMSPEQIEGGLVDARSDIYSLGVTAYELLTGQVPFRGHDIFKIMSRHMRTPPRPPRELAPNLPAALDELLLSMLAKDPAARPQTMLEFEEVLCAIEDDASASQSQTHVPDPERGLAFDSTELLVSSASFDALADDDLDELPTAFFPRNDARQQELRSEHVAPGGTMVAEAAGAPEAVITGHTEVVGVVSESPVRTGQTLVASETLVASWDALRRVTTVWRSPRSRAPGSLVRTWTISAAVCFASVVAILYVLIWAH